MVIRFKVDLRHTADRRRITSWKGVLDSSVNVAFALVAVFSDASPVVTISTHAARFVREEHQLLRQRADPGPSNQGVIRTFPSSAAGASAQP